MPVKVVTKPTETPVDLTRAKAHLRVDHSDDDTIIEALIEAATIYAEKWMGRALIDQTLDFYMDDFPAVAWIDLPRPPLIEVVGVFYSSGGVEVEFTDFETDDASEPARIYLAEGGSWPTADTQKNAVRIRYRAGYLDTSVSPATDDVPESIKAAILLYIGTLYEFRETLSTGTVAPLPWAAEAIMRMHRVELSLA